MSSAALEVFSALLDAWDDERRARLATEPGFGAPGYRTALAAHLFEVELWRRKFREALARGDTTREICSECGRISAVGFHVPDEVWRTSLPLDQREDILCIGCFARLADRANVAWDREIQFFPVSKKTHREGCQQGVPLLDHALREIRPGLQTGGASNATTGEGRQPLGFAEPTRTMVDDAAPLVTMAEAEMRRLDARFQCPECGEWFAGPPAYAQHCLAAHQGGQP